MIAAALALSSALVPHAGLRLDLAPAASRADVSMNFFKNLAAATAPDRGVGAEGGKQLKKVSRTVNGKKSPAGAVDYTRATRGYNTAVMNPTARQTPGKAKPLSPGSNYPAGGAALHEQSYGFGNWIPKFQLAKGKSKYGVPIFLPNGNINPAYLKAEREDKVKYQAKNINNLRKQREKMKAKGTYFLDSYLANKIGNVGSNKDYYNSGR